MTDTTAIQHVLKGYLADIAYRTTLIVAHDEQAEALRAANAADAAHAEVAQALIASLLADPEPDWPVPGDELTAAALVADGVRAGKHAVDRIAALAALLDAEADILAADGVEAAALVHDHNEHAPDCPACLLLGSGDLAVLDGVEFEDVA